MYDITADNMIGIPNLSLNYEAHLIGLDGECFHYTVYFNSSCTDDNIRAINNAIDDYFEQYYKDDVFIGDIDVFEFQNAADIELDLGNVDEKYQNLAIQGILISLNKVPDIKLVLINEGLD